MRRRISAAAMHGCIGSNSCKKRSVSRKPLQEMPYQQSPLDHYRRHDSKIQNTHTSRTEQVIDESLSSNLKHRLRATSPMSNQKGSAY